MAINDSGPVYLTRVEKFNAGHKLHVDEWSEEKNREVFGKCANPNWHGHNYKLLVTVKGIPDLVTGFVVDARKLSAVIKEEIIEPLDHKNLNLDVPFLPKDTQPTTENMAILIWQQLENRLGKGLLYRVQLWETDKIYAEYFGSA